MVIVVEMVQMVQKKKSQGDIGERCGIRALLCARDDPEMEEKRTKEPRLP